MKRLFLAGSGLLLWLSGARAETTQVDWDYRSDAALPAARNGLQMAVSSQTTPDGGAVLEVGSESAREDLVFAPYLSYRLPSEKLDGAKAVEITFWAKGAPGVELGVRVTGEGSQAKPTPADSFPLDDHWKKITFREPLAAPPGATWTSAPRILVQKYRAGQKIDLGPVHLKILDEAPATTAAPAPELPAGWKPLRTDHLYVRAGSALDFTPFADPAPAGSHGRVIANARGEAAFASRPEVAVRFFSFQLLPDSKGSIYGMSDAEVADFAAGIARQGYNLVRFHFLDRYLCGTDRLPRRKARPPGARLPQTPEEIQFDPQALDRFHLLLSELKKRGVYWNLDLMTSFAGYTNSGVWEVDKSGPQSTKVQLLVNPEFRANWKAGVSRLLGGVNPYTGLALKDDPALAFASCLNEQEILFPLRNYGHELDVPWHQFLHAKYPDYRSLFTAWGGRCGAAALSDSGTIDDVPPIDATVLTETPAGRDMARCCGQIEAEMSRFYLGALQEIGYSGLVSNWNMRTRVGTVPARALFPVITMNGYHAHPTDSNGHQKVVQESALVSGGNSFKNQAVARFLDRPFLNTEFGIVFWSRYRHEQGLLYGAGAALQGWTGINCHAGQVGEAGIPVAPFDAGSDPVIRASEVVEAFAFRRGDVAPSTHSIEIPLTDEFIYGGHAMGAIDDELSRLWSLCRVGITYGEKRADVPATLTLPPDKTSSIGGSLGFSAVESSTSNARLTTVAAKLRQLGALAPENRTDPRKGLLQSDTGELLLDTASGGELQVCAPRLEGAVIKQDRPVKLGAVTVEKCTVPASVTLISLDADKPLRESGRLLLVFSTDARNSRMKFTDANEDTLLDLGELPVLARTGKLTVTLARGGPAPRVRAYALGLDGERLEEIPATQDEKGWTLDIDTARLDTAGPTPFFEIVSEK